MAVQNAHGHFFAATRNKLALQYNFLMFTTGHLTPKAGMKSVWPDLCPKAGSPGGKNAKRITSTESANRAGG
jgi:hypothetical protein